MMCDVATSLMEFNASKYSLVYHIEHNIHTRYGHHAWCDVAGGLGVGLWPFATLGTCVHMYTLSTTLCILASAPRRLMYCINSRSLVVIRF